MKNVEDFNMKKKLDFIIIGAGKSGTTWVWNELRHHDSCFLPADKELNYFNCESLEPVGSGQNANFGKSINWYHSFFSTACKQSKWGEVSPVYLWSKTAPEGIYAYNENIKIIAILRDPVERAFSQFLYRRQRGYVRDDMEFEECIATDVFVLDRSLYFKHLSRYYELFDRNQIRVLFFEDLKASPQRILDELCEFIGVAKKEVYSRDKVNLTQRPKRPRLMRVLRTVEGMSDNIRIKDLLIGLMEKLGVYRPFVNMVNKKEPYDNKPSVNRQTRHRLIQYFDEDVRSLENLLDVNLDLWKEI